MNSCQKLLRTVFVLCFLCIGTKASFAACSGITTLDFSIPALSGCGIPKTITFDNVTTGGQANNSGYIWKVNGVRVDSTFGTAPNFSYTFLGAGTHVVRLIVVRGTCRDSVQKNVTITSGAPQVYGGNGLPSYTPTFNNCILNPIQSANYSVTLSSPSVLNNYKVIWGDGTDVSGASLAIGATLSHTYTTLGLFNLQIITQNAGCFDTLNGSVVNMRPVSTSIKPLPAGQLAGCAPHTITFQDTTEFALPGTILTWTFGDGTVVTRDWTQANMPISHTYQKEASQQCIFTVTLKAFNPNCNTGVNNASTYSISPILIFDEDIARINPPTNLCEPSLTYTFGNSSTDNCITGTRWYYWDFGDGTNSGWINSKNPQTHTYPRIDTFTVMLIDSNGCGSDTTFATVIFNKPPNVGYTIAPKFGCAPLNVTFNDTSLGIGNSTLWTFNGTTPGTSSALTTTRTFNTPGVYQVRLRVSNVCATNIDKFDTIRVYARPNVQIGNVRSGCVPHSVQLQNNTVNQSPNATYFWDFGNGVTSTQRNPPVANYITTGTFTVKLVVTDTCGKDSQLVTIAVSTLPVVSFNATNVCKGNATTFTNTSTLAPGDTVAVYKWYYGNGDSSTTGTSPQQYTYANDGNYNVVLQVTTDKTCVARDTMAINVKASPVPSIANSPVNICDKQIVTFNGTVTTTAPTTISSYRWSFGTADTARVEDTVYRFPSPGPYTIIYSATNSVGCSASTTKNITVHPNPDSRPFKIPIICRAQRAQFTDSSTVGFGNTITKWAWDFDNNGTIDDSTQHPGYVYNATGTGIKVKLTVTTNNNCSNTDSIINVTVNNKPNPAISSNGPALCKGDTFKFSNSTLFAFAYQWTFGDTSQPLFVTSTAQLPHVYTDTGLFTVKMLAISAQGCRDSITTAVTSRPLPDAEFTMPDTIGCAPKNFTFNNTSILANGYKWLVGNTPTSTAFNRPDTLISLSGQVVQIKLVASNQFNCKPDTAVKTLYTFGNPTPNFTMSKDSGCGPMLVTFTNTTPNGINYTWKLGNGQAAGSVNASSTYLPSLNNDSVYTIKLIASNGPGCSDSITKTIRVYPKPVSAFTHAINNGCGPLPVTFTNTSNHKFGGTISNMTFAWSFGNNTSSTQQSPTGTFTASAIQDTNYTVRLIAFSRFGCSDTSTSTVKVFPNPRSAFAPVQAAGCGPHTTAFSNTSVPNDTGSINIMSFAWRFGNGNTSAQQNPNATFTASKTIDSLYSVRLVAFSEHGCRDTSYQTVRVYPNPKALFTTNVSSGCGPLPVSFSNQSVPNDTGSIDIMSFVWDFDNGFGSIARNPSSQYVANYLTDTTYRVKLRAISEHGCLDSLTKQVVVHPKPITAFTQNKNAGCGPLPVQFTSTSQLATKHYWNFGNGDTAMRANPLYTFSSFPIFDSIYEISLSTQSAYGCLGDTIKANVIARYQPVASFFTSNDSVCGGGNIAFYNASLGGASNSWNFGNGQTASGINPAMNFSGLQGKDTTYKVRLVVSSPYGCKDTTYNPVKVNALPEAIFTNVAPGCTPRNITFTNTSLRGTKYEWDFGDATTSDSVAPTKLFTNNIALVNRTYPVTLKAISAGGCIDTMKQNILVYPLPLPDFTAQKAARCDTTQYTFNNSSQGAATYNWRFGDGTSQAVENPVHFYRTSFTQDTTYTVKMTATSNQGCKDSVQKSVLAHPLVHAKFNASSTSGCGLLNAQFINQSLNAVSYFWEFGDGAGSNKITPTYLYNSIGTYNVRLTAYDQFGCSDTAEKSNFISIYEVPKAVFFYSPLQTRLPNTTINFYDSSVLSSGTLTYDWAFGDPLHGSNASVLKNPSHNYSDSGDFNTRLIVTSDKGCKDTAVKAVRILPYLPVPGFTYNPAKGCQPHKVTFTNTSQYADAYEWDFGDGSKSTDVNPQHTYNNEGKYTVSLLAKGPGGRIEAKKDTIITVYPLPKAAFTASKTKRCDTTEYVFLNSSQGAATYQWRFGDNTASPAHSPTHYYRTQASADVGYTIKLVVTTAFGCQDSVERSIIVHPLVKAQFSSLTTTSCQDIDVEFQNNSVNSNNHFWLFGDGQGSSQHTPKHKYTSTGSYDVMLIAYDQYGCTDTANHTNFVNVFEIPKAAFSYNPFEPRQPNTLVNFTDLSFVGAGSLTHDWEFGDPASGSNTSTQQNPSHIYSDSGSFTAKLTVTSNNGCKHSTTRTVRIFPQPPIPKFTYNPDKGCRPLTVTFNSDQTTYAYDFLWEFGDGSRSTEKNPVHVYKNSSSEPYTVSLFATGPGGRVELTKDTIITVYDLPKANFVANPLNLYLPDAESVFTNISYGAIKAKWFVFDEDLNPIWNDTSFNTRYKFANKGKYRIMMVAENEFGCIDTMLGKNIVLVDDGGKIHVPTAFTPNGDNSNETFIPVVVGVRKEDYEMRIYDRWGRLVFETNDPNKGWDGQISGAPAVTDVYVWIVEGTFVTDERFVKKGSMTLIR